MPQYINPNEGKIRIASVSGHVVFIGQDEPVDIMPHMESEARAKGCMPYSSYLALAEKVKVQMEARLALGGEKTGDAKSSASRETKTEELTDEQKLKKVVEVIELMLDADAGENYFTTGGLPRAAEVSALAGFEVGKELREQAWEKAQEAAK